MYASPSLSVIPTYFVPYTVIQTILQITLPLIQELIQSKAVPALKRKAYQIVDNKADKLISDLAQNAIKIQNTTDNTKKLAYIEGTKLGIDTLRKIAEKLNKAADEIEKVL